MYFLQGGKKNESFIRGFAPGSWTRIRIRSKRSESLTSFHATSCHFPAVLCRFKPWNLYDSCQQSRMHHEKLKAALKHKKSQYLFEESEDSQVVPCMMFF